MQRLKGLVPLGCSAGQQHVPGVDAQPHARARPARALPGHQPSKHLRGRLEGERAGQRLRLGRRPQQQSSGFKDVTVGFGRSVGARQPVARRKAEERAPQELPFEAVLRVLGRRAQLDAKLRQQHALRVAALGGGLVFKFFGTAHALGVGKGGQRLAGALQHGPDPVGRPR